MKITQIIIFIILGLLAITLAFILFNLFGTTPSFEGTVGLNWYISIAKQWELEACILRTSQVTLAILAIISSVLSAAKWKPAWIPDGFLAVLAATSIALFTGLDLNTQSNKMRNAARNLNFAIIEFKQNTNENLDMLRNAYKEAEILIGDYNPQIGKTNQCQPATQSEKK